MIKIDIEVDPISTYITMLFDHLLTKNQTLTNNVTYGGGFVLILVYREGVLYLVKLKQMFRLLR